MTRKEFLVSLSAGLPLPGQPGPKRNIVIILGDDHRFDFLGALGHPWLKTPHLDRLIEGGALFENAFVTTSLCPESRASILTGRYATPHQSPRAAAMFPHILQQSGYRTALIGKWNVGSDSDEPRPGFTKWVSFRGTGVYKNPTLNLDGTRRRTGGYICDILTDEARKFIGQSAPGDQPFLLILSHKGVTHDLAPHDRYRAHFANEPIPYPKSMPNTEQNYRGRPQWVRRQRESWHGVDGMYNRRVSFDQFYRDYCRYILSIDESAGAILDELEKRRILNETLIVYASDNGFQIGEHGLIDKRTMYEASIRIPLIMHCRELVKPGTNVSGLALNIDIAPTVLDAAGVEAPEMHGRSLFPLVRGTVDSIRSEFIYEYLWDPDYPQTPTTIGLRTTSHSFMRYHGIWDLDELYDMEQDPEQMNNLLSNTQLRADNRPLAHRIPEPELRKLVEELQARLAKLVGDAGGRSGITLQR